MNDAVSIFCISKHCHGVVFYDTSPRKPQTMQNYAECIKYKHKGWVIIIGKFYDFCINNGLDGFANKLAFASLHGWQAAATHQSIVKYLKYNVHFGECVNLPKR